MSVSNFGSRSRISSQTPSRARNEALPVPTASSPTGPARFTSSKQCFPHARSFVHVRPYIGDESTFVAPEQVVPRPAILYEKSTDTITVLDPTNRFKPKKNGVFTIEGILWGFLDPDGDSLQPAPITQKEIYNQVVTPLFPSIQEGYGCAFVVSGGIAPGKMHSMYGDSWSGSSSGIFPRFCDAIFDVMKAQLREDTTFTVEMEALEFTNEQCHDLLSKKKKELKVREDAVEGPVAQGCTRISVSSSSELKDAAKQAVKVVRKHHTTHSITIRIVETCTFRDPEDPSGQSTVKSRRMNINFLFLRPMSTVFARCCDIAVERDTGENPNAKPPVRESAFTRLHADIFNHSINVTFVTCISPFCEDVKETMNSLAFARKVLNIRTNPRLSHDDSMLELRRLTDEIKNLDQNVAKTDESMKVVQEELDRRQHELHRQERRHRELVEALSLARTEEKAMAAFRQREAVKFHKFSSNKNDAVDEIAKQVKKKMKERAIVEADIERVKEQCEKAESRVESAKEEVEKLKENITPYQDEMKKMEAEEEEVNEKEVYINALPEERQEIVAELQARAVRLQDEVAQVQNQRQEIKADTNRLQQEEVKVKQSDQFKWQQAIEKTSTEIDELKAQIAKEQREIESLEKECENLENEIKLANKNCCVVM